MADADICPLHAEPRSSCLCARNAVERELDVLLTPPAAIAERLAAYDALHVELFPDVPDALPHAKVEMLRQLARAFNEQRNTIAEQRNTIAELRAVLRRELAR